MIFHVVAFALLLHVQFWGAGLAVLAMPRRWRRFWPMLVMPAGFALQSAIVWAGAWANLRGTNRYALAGELIPFALLVIAFRRRGPGRAFAEFSRWSGVALATVACLATAVGPLALASKGLTTVSLGSNDAADYAAGARVLMEFAHGDREGFIGLTEVVRVMSVDNFFDFWLRLNHFTPSALMALNGSVLHCAPHEIVGLTTLVIFAGALPVVFWIARALLRLRPGASWLVMAIYAASPIPWYAVAHVATGQLLAGPAIALLTWAGVALWREPLTWRRGVQFAGVLAIGCWLVLGSYNFFLVVCLAPAIAFAGGLALVRGEWRRFARWLLLVLAPLAACALVFADRVAGLLERLQLFQSYDFGWRIPVLTPEGWLGLLRGPDLAAWPAVVRWLLALGVIVLALRGAVRMARRGGARRSRTAPPCQTPFRTPSRRRGRYSPGLCRD